jgi:hypothetical protein
MNRGFRNNNPGNIDFHASIPWQGQLGVEEPPAGGGRPRFARFDTLDDGLRALAINSLGYQLRHRVVTPLGFVRLHAPGADNNNETTYAATIAEYVFGDDADVDRSWDLTRVDQLYATLRAVVHVENAVGRANQPPDPITRDQYVAAINAAYAHFGVVNA